MMKFYWPYLSLLLPLPIILMYISKFKNYLFNSSNKSSEQTNTGLVIPFYEEFIKINSYLQHNKSSRFNINNILKCIIWSLFVLACMRPVWLGAPIALPVPAHDIIMAIDISGSMQAEDMSESFRQSRLDVVKDIAHKFIDMRTSDRLGLIFFGSQAFLSSPLTLDQKSLHNFLEKTQIGFAGQRTAIGDALGLAIKRLKLGNSSDNTRFIVLLSDGSNTSGAMEPLAAARIAAENNIKIYTIGIGKSTHNFFDIQAGMDLDEDTLKSIANLTNGVYFHATSSRALNNIYQEINALEPNTQDAKILRPEDEWFIYPLLGVYILSSLLALINVIYLPR